MDSLIEGLLVMVGVGVAWALAAKLFNKLGRPRRKFIVPPPVIKPRPQMPVRLPAVEGGERYGLPTFAPPASEPLQETADRSFSKGYWEAARTLYERCLDAGDTAPLIPERILECIISTNEASVKNKRRLIKGLHQKLLDRGRSADAQALKRIVEAEKPEVSPFRWWRRC